MAQRINPYHTFPSNKFHPPQLDHSQLLLRNNLPAGALPQGNDLKKIVVIEAQAGQGKTTLAYQHVQLADCPYCWYRVDPRDVDPVLFLSALYLNVKHVVEGFNSPKLEKLFEEGTIDVDNLRQYSVILIADVNQCLKKELILVFDDLHLIDFAEATIQLLDHIITISPANIRFILTSRHQIILKNTAPQQEHHITRLTTKELSLDAEEIEQFFLTAFNKVIDSQGAAQIRNITDGWITGIILTGIGFSTEGAEKNKLPHDSFSSPASQEALNTYFRNEIFAILPQELQELFMKLSLLNELSIELAKKIITDMDNLSDKMIHFTQNYYFLNQLDTDQQTFSFHHLFQDYLQTEAKQHLSTQETRDIYKLSAKHYLNKQNLYESLTYSLKAADYSNIEKILKQEMDYILANPKNITISQLLKKIPTEVLHQHGWLCLISGILFESTSPTKPLPLLKRAQDIFNQQNENIGELLALSQSLSHYLFTSGNHNHGAWLLRRTTQLFNDHFQQLSTMKKMLVGRWLGTGYCIFLCNVKQGRKYTNMVIEMATQQENANFIIASRFILGYAAIYADDKRECSNQIERITLLLPNPDIAIQFKLMSLFLAFDYLSLLGDHINFTNQVQNFKTKVRDWPIKHTIAPQLICFHHAMLFVSEGEFNQALEVLNQGIALLDTFHSDNLRSQLLQWRAYTLAILEDKEQSIRDMEESSLYNETAGGRFHTVLHQCVKGVTFLRLGKEKEAEKFLNQTLQMANEISSQYLTCIVFMHKAYLGILQQNDKEIRENLAAGLKIMRKYDYTYFWTWEPGLMTKLLQKAVCHKIEKSFARRLAQERLQINIDKKGNCVPLLRISLLDSFGIHYQNNLLFSSREFSEQQRELLDILLSSTNQQAKITDIQEALWPDEDGEKARMNFDGLHARLRKTLQKKLPADVKNYLRVKKSTLFIKNCSIDSEEFLTFAKKGIRLSKNKQYWQAGNCFNYAFNLWKGSLPYDLFMSNDALLYSYKIEKVLVEAAQLWGTILSQADLTERAIDLIENLILKFRTDDGLITFLYGLYLKTNSPLIATETLKRYRQELEKAGYPENEIDAIIAGVVIRFEDSPIKASS